MEGSTWRFGLSIILLLCLNKVNPQVTDLDNSNSPSPTASDEGGSSTILFTPKTTDASEVSVTEELAEDETETVTEEVTEDVTDKVTDENTEEVTETVTEEVTDDEVTEEDTEIVTEEEVTENVGDEFTGDTTDEEVTEVVTEEPTTDETSEAMAGVTDQQEAGTAKPAKVCTPLQALFMKIQGQLEVIVREVEAFQKEARHKIKEEERKENAAQPTLIDLVNLVNRIRQTRKDYKPAATSAP